MNARLKLAAAIAQYRQATSHVAKLQEASTRAREAVWAADRALEQAQSEFEDAKKHADASLVETFIGGGDSCECFDAKSTAVAKAEAAVEKARKIRDAIERELRECDGQALIWEKDRLNAAIYAVIAADPATRKLYELYRQARRNMADAHAALSVIRLGLPRDLQNWDAAPAQDDPTPSAALWRAALTALADDPSAALPS